MFLDRVFVRAEATRKAGSSEPFTSRFPVFWLRCQISVAWFFCGADLAAAELHKEMLCPYK